MVAAPDDQRHPLGDAHPLHGAGVRRVESDPKRVGRAEGDHLVPLQRSVVHPGPTGKAGAVGYERHQPVVSELAPEVNGVLHRLHVPLQGSSIQRVEEEGRFQGGHRRIHQLRGAPAQDPAAPGREADPEPGLHLALGGDEQAAPLQHLLARAEYSQLAALSRAAVRRRSLQGAVKAAVEKIAGGDAPQWGAVRPFRQPGFGRRHDDAHAAGGGERVALDVIDDEPERFRVVRPFDALVGTISRPVDVVENADEVAKLKHRISDL